jgi:hypothetical protein
LGRRQLLTDEERRLQLGVPGDADSLARRYTFTRSDQDLVGHRRGAPTGSALPSSSRCYVILDARRSFRPLP